MLAALSTPTLMLAAVLAFGAALLAAIKGGKP